MPTTTERTDPLYSLDGVKAWMDTKTGLNDALILEIGNQVSAFVERYCGRKFRSASYTHDGTTLERLTPHNLTDLWLPNAPVTAVSSLKAYNGGTALTESTDGYTGDFVVHQGIGLVRLINGNGFPYQGLPSVEITYTGGYLASGAAAALRKEFGWDDAAGDLQTAVNKQIAWLYDRRKHETEGVASVSSGGTTVQYLTDALLPDVRETLDSYCRILPSVA